jgi:ComF family protein
MAGGWALALKNLFFPVFCKQCGVWLLTEENGFFCPTCWEMSPRVARPFCTICGRPHKGAVGFGTLHNFPCADCRDKNRRPFGRIYGAAVYAESLETAIKLFKFHSRKRLAVSIAGVMAEFAEREMELDAYDLLVPVPLHRVRQRERGYNQSLLLARELEGMFAPAVVRECLVRVRPTHVQSRIRDPKARRANVKGAFAVNEGADVAGKRILLIDDVITTSGTVSECATVLKKAKAASVDIFASALAVPHRDLVERIVTRTEGVH